MGDGSLERAVLAALIAGIATVALPIGAALGVFTRPSHRLVAVVMAFGSGALVEALAVELAFEGAHRLVHEHEYSSLAAWGWVAGGFALGGLIFFLANAWLEKRGGALRKPSTTDAYLGERKREAAAALLAKLARVNLLRALPPHEMEGLLPHVHPVNVAAGDVIFRAGEPGDALYLIDSGRVDILGAGVDPSRPKLPAEGYAPIASLGPGDSFGEIALLSQGPRSASAVASEDTDLLRVAKEDFDQLMGSSPALRGAVEEVNLERVMRSARSATSADVQQWQDLALRSVRRANHAEHAAYAQEAKEEHGGAPLAIFLGTLLDGIPECIVIGASFTSLAAFNPSFVVAVFLNNLPEAMSSAVGMARVGFSKTRILMLWASLTVAGLFVAAAGNLFLSEAPPALNVFVNGIAGGGILAMLAATMMPEAFEEGGPSVGLATIAGFLAAFYFAVPQAV